MTMTPEQIAESLSVATTTVQLAVGAIYEELRTLPRDDPRAKMLRHQLNVSYGKLAPTLRALPNVVTLPVKQKTRWTVIKHLDGSMHATSHDFGVSGAWGWIVDTIAEEYRMSETEADERIGSREGTEDQYDGDDLVTIDGEPVYRIEHTATPFSK